MASQQLLTTVTLSGSFTTGPGGGLLPAAPTNRLQDFPFPSGYTPAGEKFNFKILAALASPFVVAIIIIIIEIITCCRWRRMTARLPKRPRQEPQPWTRSITTSRIVAEPLSRTIAELPARSESRLAVLSETSTVSTRSDGIWRTAGAREASGVSYNAEAGPRLWPSRIGNAGRLVSNTDNAENLYDG